MVVVLSRFRVANGMEPEVARAFRERPRAVDAVPGFLGLEVFVDEADRASFYLLTRWTDVASYERWHRTEHKASHALIPRGLRLDPSFTRLDTLARVDGVSGTPLTDVITDSTPLLDRYTEASEALHLFRTTPDGTIVVCNPAACAQLAAGASLAGRPLFEFMPAADASSLRRILEAGPAPPAAKTILNFGAANKVPYSLDCWIEVRPDGATIIGEPTFRRDHLLHDTLMAMNQELAVLSRDRTREAGEQRHAREAAERLNEERNAFLTVLVHELRQPVGAALAALGVLRKLNNDPQLERPRNHLDRQLRQIVRLLEDLADTAKVTGGEVKLRRVPIDLDMLLRELSMTWEGLAEREQKPFTCALAGAPLVVSGDPERLQQVFSNIVGNAFKYTPPGGSIQVAAERQDGWAQVTVRDEGEGIPADRLPHVFDLFQRATTSASGLGVGLAVVRGLVDAHGGTVSAESAGQGQGSTFRIRLPLA